MYLLQAACILLGSEPNTFKSWLMAISVVGVIAYIAKKTDPASK